MGWGLGNGNGDMSTKQINEYEVTVRVYAYNIQSAKAAVKQGLGWGHRVKRIKK